MIKTGRQRITENRKGMILVSVLLVVVAGISAVLLLGQGDAEVSYRETQAQYGNLVVGITESGSVDIGTVDQTFELDMSALQRADTGDTNSSLGAGGGNAMAGQGGNMGGNMTGGMDMFNQMFSMAEGNNYTSSGEDSKLTVAQVMVSVGQQVQEGDVLYRLEEDSVEELEDQLQSNVEKAKADLDAVYAQQTLSKQTAQYTYDSSMAYGSYSGVEYEAGVSSLQDAVAQKETALELAKKSLESYQEQLIQTIEDYEAAGKVLADCEWSCDNVDKWANTYEYVTNFELAQSAASNVSSLEQKKEQLAKNVEQAQKNVETCTQELNTAQRALELGLLSAKQTRFLRELAYSTARESYDLTLSYLEDDVAEQEEIYADAREKWEEFSSHIKDNTVCSRYSGVITSVDLTEGDSIHTNDTLVTLYNLDEVTISVSVDESDLTDISPGTSANVTFTAYPDQIFQAEVTEISDASTDSSGNITYKVTATLQGDVTGLFQGMTGDITFITKENKDVLYVSNRAISREGTKSYVKVRDEKGAIRRQEVTTGFSDGINVEIMEGLSEGDVVLIESKVGES